MEVYSVLTMFFTRPHAAVAMDHGTVSRLRPRLARLLRGLHEQLHVKLFQTFVSGSASHVKPVLKPSTAYTGKVKP